MRRRTKAANEGDVGVLRCPLYVPARPTALKRLLHLASFSLSSSVAVLAQWRWKPELVVLVVPTLFCAPQPQSPEEVQRFVAEFEAATRGDEFATVRRVIAIWLRAALLRNRKYPILLPELDDLQELSIMLSQRIEQWAEGYIASSRVEGRMEGRAEGEARVLERLLTRRFGLLPAWAEARLNAAGEAELEQWTDAVFDAASLIEVLGPPPADH